ncbi:ABC transporter ATP-binding protein [Diaminobutyricimonas sp. TR449]|uniref:ABC transporter ATP-binding protein n=1 Tax=Diaminobutyricimonas sp. TR449 TaxID=2708076 RepID=UPI0014234291|nr:ABC transporter ATP-binding protein [Diaminobutyricimonas sp. TR449]
MLLPIADAKTVRATARALIREHRGALASVLVLHSIAALGGLAGPWLIGRMIDAMTTGTATQLGITIAALILVAAYSVQGFVSRFAQKQAMVLGETVFAKLREQFMATVGRLPLSVVERAGTGDLLARTTNDISSLSQTVRFGIPRVLVAAATTLLTLVAAFLTNPLVALGLLVGVPSIALVTRWYLRRSGRGYQRQLASHALLSGVISETVEGARTIEALSLAPAQQAKIDAAVLERRESERYTLNLRTVWLPTTELSFLVPIVVVIGWGAYLVSTGAATVGEVTAVALYGTQLIGPVNELLGWMDELQIGATALSRIIGVADVPPDREPVPDAMPADEKLVARAVKFHYGDGREVLHGIDLDLSMGERLAIVGPSGSGKSTLGRLMAGINAPTSGSMRVGGVPVTDLPLETLRGHVALVTQEHHVFVGSIADNLRLAKPGADVAELESALAVVDALIWVRHMPDGLETQVGSGGVVLTPAQAQQIALARLVLLDPHTLVLDEATSLLDPGAARDLETSLERVLAGRTVVAIAHRLHTAHDADRVAVVQSGRIVELGPHESLVAAGGEYAALWTSWHHEDAGHA